VQNLENETACEKCGEIEQPAIKAVVSVRIDDGTGQINAVAYGKEAEKIIGLSKEELLKQAKERGSEALIEELQELAGKEISIAGKIKDNSFSGEKDLRASFVELKE
jgi:DNA/RNA endonuclease YhcR with UshA esterase domain